MWSIYCTYLLFPVLDPSAARVSSSCPSIIMTSEPVTTAPPTTTGPVAGLEKQLDATTIDAPDTTPAPVAVAAAAAAEQAPAPAPAVAPAAAAPAAAAAAQAEEQKKVGPAPAAAEETTPAAAPVPTEEKKSDAAVPEKKKAENVTPLELLLADLPAVIQEAGHGEIWGIELEDGDDVPTTIVLEKFLRANAKDVVKAKAQLTEALKWRKKVDPAKLLAEVAFDKSKFGSLGYVTVYPKTEAHAKEIVTWNIYGAVKDNKATFGNVEE